MQGWQGVRDWMLPRKTVRATDARVAALARDTAPLVWLAGKVQSGKTSIVRALTDATEAEIGEGFKACTRDAAIFDFPEEAPIIRFLDTRGLGEKGYDPGEDIASHEGRAHVLMVVARAMDPQQTDVVNVVRRARQKHPQWPVIVAQTTLHEAYAKGQTHAFPYPYASHPSSLAVNPAIPADLLRALAYQRELLAGLPGAGPLLFVPLDFTKPGDRYEPREYGLSALLIALQEAAPAGLVAALNDANASGKLERRAYPHITGYAAAAAAADAVPVAGAVAVPVVQSKMLYKLAAIYEVDWNRRALAEFAACLGAGVLSRLAAGFGLRQLTKLIPVYGQTAGAAAAAAASFATTFAVGKAACYFLARHRAGESDPKGVAEAYRAALGDAFRIFGERAKAQVAA